MKKLLTAFCLLFVLVGCDSCAIHKPITGVTQLIPQTALQKVVVYNAAMSEGVKSLSVAIPSLQSSGVITANQARPVMQGIGRLSSIGRAILAITSSGTEATWNVDGPKIRALLAPTNLKLSDTGVAAVDLSIASINSALTLLTAGAK